MNPTSHEIAVLNLIDVTEKLIDLVNNLLARPTAELTATEQQPSFALWGVAPTR